MNKLFKILVIFGLAFLPLISFAASVIELPPGFTASTTAFMSGFFNDLSPFTIMIFGVLLTMVVIVILIEAIKPK